MSPTAKRIALLALVAAAVAAFFALDLGRFLTLDALKASRLRLLELYAARPVLVAACFFAAYVAMAALSLPGAVLASLAAGAVFGLALGTVLADVAAALGATLACAMSRYLLRDLVSRRFAGRLDKINQGVEREGAFYLFSLRLIPVFPFFLVNLAMGLTAMRLATFFWVSLLGMLPGALLYVNAGRELSRIQSPGDILSPSLIASLVLLGLFPLAAKRIMARLRARRTG
jgi:uncharacterized membrane protein YdjX (TVP38/TMEM64 family)